MMRASLTGLLLLICSVVWSQKEMPFAEIQESEDGYLVDANFEILDGYYRFKRDREEFSFSLASFNNGVLDGFFQTYSDKEKLLYESHYFQGRELYLRKYDEKENVISESNYYVVESSEKPNKRGRFESGSLKLVATDLNQDYIRTGDIFEYQLSDSRIQTAVETYHYRNGKVSEKWYYPNYPEVSKREMYYPNGEELFVANHYSNFPLEEWDQVIEGYRSYSTQLLANGMTRWSDEFGNPLDGNYQFQDRGRITSLYSFTDGYEDGTIYEFNDAGLLRKQWEYDNGRLDGQVIVVDVEYSNDYQIKTYRNGAQHGLEYWFSLDAGFAIDSVHYENGMKVGTEVRRFTDTESKVQTISYKNGKIHGKVETKAKTNGGSIYTSVIEFYQLGKKTGKHQEFDSLGNVTSENNYKFDKLNGLSWYDSYGRKESMYRLGKEIAYKSFNKKGGLEHEWYYEGDDQVDKEYRTDGTLLTSIVGKTEDTGLQAGDTIITAFYNQKEVLYERKFEIIDDPTYRWSSNFWKFTYDKKGKQIGTFYIEEDYPANKVTEYVNGKPVKIFNEPQYPDNGEVRVIQILNKSGEVIKECQEKYVEDEKADNGEGYWKNVDCK